MLNLDPTPCPSCPHPDHANPCRVEHVTTATVTGPVVVSCPCTGPTATRVDPWNLGQSA